MAFRILFVCLGNICRSPTAHAVMRDKAHALPWLEVDSAGTSDYHQGEPADRRSVQTLREHGFNTQSLHSRPVVDEDFYDFDEIWAMDKQNLAELRRRCPEHLHYKLGLLLTILAEQPEQVPDPYYGGADGFLQVLRLIERACDAHLQRIIDKKHN